MKIDACNLDFKELNNLIRTAKDKEIIIDRCLGQRYIGAGLADKSITVNGIPGNALGAYLDGSDITVNGNAQDAIGDTMNEGHIVIQGSAGDAIGYAMRGGKIFVHGNTGYRAGVHMKEYKDKVPLLVIGGHAGSFLGEYQAGGMIIVLGLGGDYSCPVGYFCATGMHGGKIYLCCREEPIGLPRQVTVKKADRDDLMEIRPYLEEFCRYFHEDLESILQRPFMVLAPNTKNPYKQLYTQN